MIVSKRKYREAVYAANGWKEAYENVLRERNELVNRINSGEFSPLTEDDARRIIRLCHPDKHNNSKASNEITAKLLGILGK
jgi:hypothetical protein